MGTSNRLDHKLINVKKNQAYPMIMVTHDKEGQKGPGHFSMNIDHGHTLKTVNLLKVM